MKKLIIAFLILLAIPSIAYADGLHVAYMWDYTVPCGTIAQIPIQGYTTDEDGLGKYYLGITWPEDSLELLDIIEGNKQFRIKSISLSPSNKLNIIGERVVGQGPEEAIFFELKFLLKQSLRLDIVNHNGASGPILLDGYHNNLTPLYIRNGYIDYNC